MPFGDRTGPQGLGPMTGRGAGYCGGYPAPGHMNPVPGRGFGRGPVPWGAAYGSYALAYGPAYAPSYGPEDERTALKDQARYFEEALQDIKKRIEEIESSAEKD